jgi:hypothetical protein
VARKSSFKQVRLRRSLSSSLLVFLICRLSSSFVLVACLCRVSLSLVFVFAVACHRRCLSSSFVACLRRSSLLLVFVACLCCLSSSSPLLVFVVACLPHSSLVFVILRLSLSYFACLRRHLSSSSSITILIQLIFIRLIVVFFIFRFSRLMLII